MKRKQEQGFTLVEIAIVLVIIGLLLGGLLKGQEMITQAKIKNLIADFSGISAAYHGYNDRYRAIPGDDLNAGGAGGRWGAAATSGDGDGVVEGNYNTTGTAPTDATGESRRWWDHLRRAGFVAGTGDQQPFNAVTGMLGVQTGGGTTAGGALGFVSLIVCSANMPDKIAIAVDTQMDDGNAASGTVRARLHSTTPNPAINGAVETANYVESGTNVYTLCRAL